MGPAPRDVLIARAREIAGSTEENMAFTLNGEELCFPTMRAVAPHDLAAMGSSRVLALEDAGLLSERMLRAAAEISDQMLDRASRRGADALERIAAMQERQAELQARHAKTTLSQAVDVQQWVGGLTATISEERLKLAQIQTSEDRLARKQALESVARDVQLAKITAERDIHLAQINRPSTGGVLIELAVAFAGQYAHNAAANFAHMNDEPRES